MTLIKQDKKQTIFLFDNSHISLKYSAINKEKISVISLAINPLLVNSFSNVRNELFTNIDEMSIMNITPNHLSSSYLLNIIREDKKDICISENFDTNKLELFLLENSYKKLDFLFFEFNKNDVEE